MVEAVELILEELEMLEVLVFAEVLREEGQVDSRQGFGWFVAGDRVQQSLGALATIEDQLTAQGRVAERRVLSFGFVDAPADLPALAGAPVLEVRRVNLADGQPELVQRAEALMKASHQPSPDWPLDRGSPQRQADKGNPNKKTPP